MRRHVWFGVFFALACSNEHGRATVGGSSPGIGSVGSEDGANTGDAGGNGIATDGGLVVTEHDR